MFKTIVRSRRRPHTPRTLQRILITDSGLFCDIKKTGCQSPSASFHQPQKATPGLTVERPHRPPNEKLLSEAASPRIHTYTRPVTRCSGLRGIRQRERKRQTETDRENDEAVWIGTHPPLLYTTQVPTAPPTCPIPQQPHSNPPPTATGRTLSHFPQLQATDQILARKANA